MIRCKVLGPVEVTADGRAAPPELLWRRHLALLVYLARSPKRTRSRDHLIGLLWPDKPEAAARHSLREAIRVLRRCAGADAVDTAGQHVKLALDAVQLDVDDLERLLGAGDWTGAMALVAGEFMEGFVVPGASDLEDWLASERMAWRARCLEAFAHGGDSALRDGRLELAGDVARRGLALDPLSEIAVRLSMHVLALRGDRNAALSEFESHARRVADASGAEVSPALAALAERIERERLVQPPAQGDREIDLESRRMPLAGRGDELRALCDAWSGACARPNASFLVIEGDLGSGKTRILDELVARARLDGAATAVVRLVEADRDEAFGAVLGLAGAGLPDVPGVAGARQGALKAFAERLIDWEERFPGLTGTALPIDRAFREVVAAVAEETPLLVAVDDAQWIDRESLLALEATLRDRESAPVALVISCTPRAGQEVWDRLRGQIGRELEGCAVSVGALGPGEVRDLARWVFPSYRDDELERVARRITADSAGLPLFVIELLHAIALGLDVDASGAGAWPKPFQTLDQSLPGDLPDGIIAAIRVGFRRLSAPAQQVLAAASVLDERVTSDTLSRATGLPIEEVHPALDEAEWHRWMVADARGYSYVARIVRDVVARDMVTPGQRQRLRDAVGR